MKLLLYGVLAKRDSVLKMKCRNSVPVCRFRSGNRKYRDTLLFTLAGVYFLDMYSNPGSHLRCAPAGRAQLRWSGRQAVTGNFLFPGFGANPRGRRSGPQDSGWF
jgi:hypothetical protein